ncbi:cysteine-rich receptor-like protein kinase 3 [Cornus florida]|uniref:cysteine-rich receptor-like protein kinase 3 n=1 Tax=Cornus florida TaxID=4283 RepID=UPI00289E6707|nr:cysteine-rich receptor-like protein kinase 3 [Cornus florida]
MGFGILCALIYLCFLVNQSVSDPRATEAALICSNISAASSDRQVFVANFLAAMEALTPLIANQGYGDVVNGSGNTTVYAFGECMKDLSQNDCNLCFAQCKTSILRCVPFQKLTRGGRNFFDGCYLRYDDYMFFNESSSSVDTTVCGNGSFGGNQTLFRSNVVELMKNLSVEGPKNDGFFVGSVNRGNLSVYGLAQCWEYVNGSACEHCLAKSVSNISSCLPMEGGRVLNAGCYMRYSTQKFYNNSASVASDGDGGDSRLAVILASTSAASAFVLTVAAVFFFMRKKVVKKRREEKQLGALLATVNKSKLNISYETLERATNYFHDSNKLGQGGSGSVYKGILPDGQTVAVKRLFFNTKQWVDHFFNEVNLISDIHHPNLVKLLGCSITGPESLLVYEYVPNQSLLDYLFVKKNVQPLGWEVRFNIILGTAEGLAYLHEESELRIIHRDIKLSNVLLDENLMPKIADFGLARLFPEDKTHISTAIAGTLGYMAPEYIVRGKLTEKADVYSFGVLLIEVVCGKRTNSFSQNSFSILEMVWNLYGTGRLCEAVDPSLDGKYQAEAASTLLQVGLLCVQASAELRPSMSIVVKMLTSNHEIPQPKQPPFLNSSSTEISPFSQKRGTNNFQPSSNTQSSGNSISESWIEPR